MKHTVLTLSLALILSASAAAQDERRADGSKGKVSKSSRLQADTQIAAQLQSSLDVKRAKTGDQVVLKTTKDVKQNGEVVLKKGTKLLGHVTEVKKKAKGNAESKIGVLFNSIQHADGSVMPITASIVSITQARATASSGDDTRSDVFASSTSRTTASSSSGGGLLGGVGNTVGGVVNTTTQTTGSVLGSTTQAAGSVTGSTSNVIGTNIKGLSVSQSSNTSARGGATLSMTGDNLKLDKGTTFGLNVSQSAGVSKN